MHPSGAVPDRIRILHNVAGQLGSWTWKQEMLYDAAASPRWREHSHYQRDVDVVALPLADLDQVAIYAHDPWATGPGIAIAVAGGVSIVGFPFGLSGGAGLGVWVQGTIATEPAIDFGGLPRFLIDSRTRQGQSGSPVIAYSAGGAVPLQNGGTAVFGGPVEQFLGVYSGRINEQSDLGFVWKAIAVREIVESGSPGTV